LLLAVAVAVKPNEKPKLRALTKANFPNLFSIYPPYLVERQNLAFGRPRFLPSLDLDSGLSAIVVRVGDGVTGSLSSIRPKESCR
jgi:hypothetical protein